MGMRAATTFSRVYNPEPTLCKTQHEIQIPHDEIQIPRWVIRNTTMRAATTFSPRAGSTIQSPHFAKPNSRSLSSTHRSHTVQCQIPHAKRRNISHHEIQIPHDEIQIPQCAIRNTTLTKTSTHSILDNEADFRNNLSWCSKSCDHLAFETSWGFISQCQ